MSLTNDELKQYLRLAACDDQAALTELYRHWLPELRRAARQSVSISLRYLIDVEVVADSTFRRFVEHLQAQARNGAIQAETETDIRKLLHTILNNYTRDAAKYWLAAKRFRGLCLPLPPDDLLPARSVTSVDEPMILRCLQLANRGCTPLEQQILEGLQMRQTLEELAVATGLSTRTVARIRDQFLIRLREAISSVA